MSSSALTWTPVAIGSGTRLYLHHSGWQGLRGFFVARCIRMGWRSPIARNRSDLLVVCAG